MIRFKTKLKNFDLPTSYSDITINDLEYFKANQDNETAIIERLTGLNSIEMQMIDLDSVSAYLSFLSDSPLEIESVEGFIIDKQYFTIPIDIGEETYLKKIQAVNCLAQSNVIGLVQTYFDIPNIGTHSVELIYSIANNLIAQINGLIERDATHLKSDTTHEQKLAGIDTFNELGEFNTIDMIARNYNYKHLEVESLSYNLIFLILFKQNIQNRFEKNYNEIMQSK